MEETKKINIIHYVICAALIFGFPLLPNFAGLTDFGMGILGSFVGAIYGWVLIDMMWPSVLALLSVSWHVGMANMLSASFGSDSVVSLIVCMMVVGVAMKNGAFTWLAMKLLTSKFTEGRGYVTIFIVFIAGWLTGSFNPIIMCIILCGFLNSMFEQVGVKKNDKLVIFCYLGLAYQLMRGQILFPFVGVGLIYMNIYKGMFPDIPFPATDYLTMMIVMGIVMAVIWLALMKFVFHVDVSPLSNYRLEGGCPTVTKGQKISLVLFVVFLAANILANVGPLTPFLGRLGVCGISMAIGALIPLIKDEQGRPLGDLKELCAMIDWGQIFLVGYVMVMSRYMTAPETGIANAMAVLFQPFVNLNPLVFVIIAMIVATILTNVANNLVVTVVCLPFIVNFAALIGMSPVGMVALLFIISEFALVTPAASPVTAVAMSQPMADANIMSRYAILMIIPLFIAFLAIAWPLSMLIF